MNKLKIKSFLNNLLFYSSSFSQIKQTRYLSNEIRNEKSLEGYLHSKIRLKGPITVAEYMKEALGNPLWGYYMKKDVFGVKGDFITAPEVSQMFGELIGVWFLNEWSILKNIYKNDLPPTVQLIEMGPGRGTLMNDLLRIWNRDKIASSNLLVYMIESSPFMRRTQIKNLCDLDQEPELFKEYKSKHSNSIHVIWLSDISDLPRKEALHFFVANEFFDALPIQKFQKTSKGYRELLVDYDEKIKKFKYVISPLPTIGSEIILKLHQNYTDFDHVEVSSESARYMDLITKRLMEYNGSMLIIDYGHNGECKDTLRAFKKHEQVDVFQEPGESDLTVDVDFSFLKHIANKSNAVSYGPVTQGEFLSQMQIGTRLQMLLRNAKSEEEKSKLLKDFNMLIKSDKMGQRFKLVSIRKFDLRQNPPGFFIPQEEDIKK